MEAFLMVIACGADVYCNRVEELFPMPSWEVCIETLEASRVEVPEPGDKRSQMAILTCVTGPAITEK